MKIPTLIGIALIVAAIGSLGFWLFNRFDAQKAVFDVSDLEVVNITDTQATIIWQTGQKAAGQVYYGESGNLNKKASDNRDFKNTQERLTHFVTLKNLKPNSRYFYKILNNSSLTPEKNLEFKTAPLINPEELNFSYLKPLKGTILDLSLNPIDESLIFLEIPGAARLATFSSTAGNFILPLKTVLNQELNQVIDISSETAANLVVKKGGLESKVKVIISESTVNLPPITIGSDLDLSNYVPVPPKTISIGTASKVNFDFNSDGKINSLDLAILRGKAVSKSLLTTEERIKFDINSDGIVGQEDVDIFAGALSSN